MTLYKLCETSAKKVLKHQFYDNEVLLEIFLQNFIPAYNLLEEEKRKEVENETDEERKERIEKNEQCQDKMILILKNVVSERTYLKTLLFQDMKYLHDFK